MNFTNFLVAIGKKEKTAKNYSAAIQGSMSNWAAEQGWVKQTLMEIDGLIAFEIIATKIRSLAIYEARNTIGKGMYNAALNAYADYLSETKGVFIEEDILGILNDQKTTETEKSILVNTRIGQGQFRKDLIEYWTGCSVTGYRNSRLLVASHIKPWRMASDNERLDVHNGLLLLPNLDKAFDLGLISFDTLGSIWVSPELEQPEVLGVDTALTINLTDVHRPYMDYHRERIFRQ